MSLELTLLKATIATAKLGDYQSLMLLREVLRHTEDIPPEPLIRMAELFLTLGLEEQERIDACYQDQE